MAISKKDLNKIWIPLAIMWIVMALEQPMITSVISRLNDAKAQLAGFGFSFALALLIEGPVVQMLSAGTAVCNSRASYKRMLKIMHYLAAITTIAHIILCIPSVFYLVSVKLLNLPIELYHTSYYSFISMIPWAAAVGYRRLWQGVMIKHGKSNLVPVVMYLRLGSGALILFIGLFTSFTNGAILGGLTLTVGVIVGMISAYIFAKPIFDELEDTKDDDLDVKSMIKFYIPLAITSWITLGVRPLLNFGISRGLYPIDSLAVWPVVIAYLFLYTSISQSLQEVVIATYSKENEKSIKSFVLIVSLTMFIVYMIVFLFKPIWTLWFVNVSKLPTDLVKYLPLALTIVSVMPFFAAHVSHFRGLLVANKRTTIITTGVFINVAVMLILIVTLPIIFDMTGVYIACIAYVAAYIIEFIYLKIENRKCLNMG